MNLFVSLLAQTSAMQDHSPASAFMSWAMLVVMIIGGLVAAFFWLWMLAACVMSSRPTPQKVGWTLVILVFNFVGAVIYYFAARGAKATI